MLQHGAYTLLIDACYDREQFPTRVEAIDWAWASSAAEVEAVDFVLSKFFTFDGDRYVQQRIAEELAAYHQTSAINRRIAKEREAKRNGACTERARSVHEAPPNHKPLTINQEPIQKITRKRVNVIHRPDDVDEQVWDDWLQLRKAKKAPVTETVIKSAIGEAGKAGVTLERFLQIWCARGSQGLEASWLTSAEKIGQPKESFYERDQRLKAEDMAKWAPGIAKKPMNFANPFEYIDVEPSNVIAIESR